MIRIVTATGALLALVFPAAAQAQHGKRPVPPPPPLVIGVPSMAPMPAPLTALNALPATPATLALGRELAELLNGGEVARLQYDKLFNETMPRSMGENPALAAVEKQHPGAIAYVVAAARPVVEKAMNDRAPLLYDRLAQIYATNLTEAELQEMLVFYRSPAGIWLVRQVAQGMDMSALFNRAMADPDTKVTSGDMVSAQQGAVISTFPNMPAEHRAALMRLGTRPVLAKLGRINPLLAAAAAQWANDAPPELQTQVNNAMIGAMQRYVAEHPAKATQ